MSRRIAILLGCGAILIGLAALLWPEWPEWRSGGTNSIAASSVSLGADRIDCPDHGTRIAIFGDSQVSGDRMSDWDTQDGVPFGLVLEQRLAGRVTVSLHGIGGQTASMGEAYWRNRVQPADIVILAYGTNDAAPRGWLRDKTAVPVADFEASLRRQIAAWQDRQRQVILMAPPPGGSAAITQRLQPYRQAAMAAGSAMQVAVLDPADAFSVCPSAQPLLARDALHMNAAGHQCLGDWLAQRLCPTGD